MMYQKVLTRQTAYETTKKDSVPFSGIPIPNPNTEPI